MHAPPFSASANSAAENLQASSFKAFPCMMDVCRKGKASPKSGPRERSAAPSIPAKKLQPIIDEESANHRLSTQSDLQSWKLLPKSGSRAPFSKSRQKCSTNQQRRVNQSPAFTISRQNSPLKQASGGLSCTRITKLNASKEGIKTWTWAKFHASQGVTSNG